MTRLTWLRRQSFLRKCLFTILSFLLLLFGSFGVKYCFEEYFYYYTKPMRLVCHSFGNFSFVTPRTIAEACAIEQRNLLIVLKSAPENALGRTLIRETWGSVAAGIGVSVFYAIGLTQTEEQQKLIDQERQHFGDIVLTNYSDTYNTLPQKVLRILKWLENLSRTKNCTFACTYVGDLDSYVHVKNLHNYCNTLRVNNVRNKILGHCFPNREQVYRGNTKWSVAKEVWPEDSYSPYCSGGAGYILTPDVPRSLLEVAEEHADLIARLHIEDALFTGILREKANPPVLIQKLYGMHLYYKSDPCSSWFISMHGLKPDMLNASWHS